MSGLGLAVGVGIVRALQAAGLDGLTLKWPNDILCNGRKLAGTLLEMSGESFGTCNVVIGIGLNCRMPERAGTGIAQPWTDVESALGRSASRNARAAHLLTHCVRVLHAFQHAGLAPFLTEWQQFDAARGKTASLRLPTEIITGTAAGIAPSGALLLTRNGTTQRYLAGEISQHLTKIHRGEELNNKDHKTQQEDNNNSRNKRTSVRRHKRTDLQSAARPT